MAICLKTLGSTPYCAENLSINPLTSADVAGGIAGVGFGVGVGVFVGLGVGEFVGVGVGEGVCDGAIAVSGVEIVLSFSPKTFLLLFFPKIYIAAK